VNAYGKSNQPDLAFSVVQKLLRDTKVIPDINVFNTLINAWAESSDPEATEQAFEVLRLIKEHPRCVQLNIVPNEVTYNSLLKCLSTTGTHYQNEISNNTAEQAEAIVSEMEQCMNDPQRRMKPDAISYTMAIRACLRVNDTSRAELLLQRMELSDTQPNTITYNIILNHCSKLQTSAAAERASQLLDYMKSTSRQPSSSSSSPQQQQQQQQQSSSMKPDLFSYSRVLTAWAGSGGPQTSTRIWQIYESMIKSDNDDGPMELNMVCYTTMIMFFTKTNSITNLNRAIQLLRAMEQTATASSSNTEANKNGVNKSNDTVRPDFWHYQAVINQAIELGHVEIAAQIVRQSVESYINGRTKKPKGLIYQKVVQEYIRYGDLETATNFVTSMKELIESHRKPIGLDIGTVKELIQAWKDSSYIDRDAAIERLENDFFPQKSTAT
jgi:pentatricopeptide repeat protein